MTLVLGGIRSGKSQYAEQIAAGFGKKILYVATAEVWPGAGSMEYRVRKHQERRPKSWLTLECPRHVASAVGESGLLDQVDGVILECVTLLASNTLYAQKDPTDYEPFQEALIEEIEALKKLIRQAPVPWVLVSSETGMGISQSDAETRHYCDGLGIANQLLAKSADEVYFMVAGLPLTVKKAETPTMNFHRLAHMKHKETCRKLSRATHSTGAAQDMKPPKPGRHHGQLSKILSRASSSVPSLTAGKASKRAR